MWWKKNKWKVIVPILVLVVLAVAFWLGGDTPGSQGWKLTEPSPMPTESVAPEAPKLETTDPTELPEETDEPEISPTPSPTMEIDPDTGKDQYQTEPVPSGKPAPVEPEDNTITETTYTCTISISCSTILNNMSYLDAAKTDLVPADGWILAPTTVTFYEGESVFDVLQRVCKQNGIHMEYENTPIYNSAYIEGIGNLYEFDCGELSGWMYQVNGWYPNYGCSRYVVQNGDTIAWRYTCDLGADVGGGYAAGSA